LFRLEQAFLNLCPNRYCQVPKAIRARNTNISILHLGNARIFGFSDTSRKRLQEQVTLHARKNIGLDQFWEPQLARSLTRT
jgi:hypothetical protein